jgi:hypothetical protein
MLRSFGRASLLYILLRTSAAYDGHLKTSHESLQNDFVLNRNKDDAVVAGTTLDDADMAHLTDSIQGLFTDSVAPVASGNSKQSESARKVISKPIVNAVPKTLPAQRPNLRKPSDARKLAAVAPRRDIVHSQLRKKGEAKVTITLEHSAKKPSRDPNWDGRSIQSAEEFEKNYTRDDNPAPKNKKKGDENTKPKQSDKKSTLVHVAKSNVHKIAVPSKTKGPLLVKSTRTELKKGKHTSKSSVSDTFPHGSSVKPITNLEKHTKAAVALKLERHLPNTPAAKVAEKPNKIVAAQDVKVLTAVEPKRDASVNIQAAQKKLIASGNRTGNSSGVGNASISVNGTHMSANKTKEIEEVVESLPMAHFALDEPKSNASASRAVAKKVENKTIENGTWVKREKLLEDEIAALKQKLSERSPVKKPAIPAATRAVKAYPSEVLEAKATISKKADDKPFLVKDGRAKSPVPSVEPVAVPVRVKQSDEAGSHVQQDANDAQVASKERIAIDTASTGLPAKKVESALAIGASIHHEDTGTTDEQDSSASSVDQDSASTAQSAPETFFGWVSSFFSWVFGSSPAITAKPVTHQNTVVPKKQSLLQARWLKQDMEKTASATEEESQHIISVNDAFGEMESEDIKEENAVRRDDVAERESAETPEIPQTPSKDALKGRHGSEMSSFWSQLESEDSDIEHSVDNENLAEYARLTSVQEERVTSAAKALQDNKLNTDQVPPLKHNDVAQLAIHEPWLTRETKDKIVEKKIHESPDLQMLQLRRKHQRK